MKKAIVVGGAGFIGSHLTLELQKRYPNAEITVYDNLLSGSWKNLVGFKGELVNSHQFLVKERNYYDVIFNLGANTDTTDESLYNHLEYNVNRGRDFLYTGKQIIYASSASVYGVGATQPSKETDDLKPANAYAFSKVQLENYMLKYYPKNSMGFRFFNVYGSKERHKKHSKSMVSQILCRVKRGENVELFPNGEQVRDFIYVKDVVDLLIKAWENPVAGIYNLGTGASNSFNNVFNAAKQLFPESKSEIEWIDNPYKNFFQEFTQSNQDKTESTFNWKPKFNLGQGMFDYYKDI